MNTKSIAAVALLATVASAATYENVTLSAVCGEDTTASNFTVPVNGTCTVVCADSVTIQTDLTVSVYADNVKCDTVTPVNFTLACNDTAASIPKGIEISNVVCNEAPATNSSSNETSSESHSEGSSAASVFVSFALVAASVVAALL